MEIDDEEGNSSMKKHIDTNSLQKSLKDLLECLDEGLIERAEYNLLRQDLLSSFTKAQIHKNILPSPVSVSSPLDRVLIQNSELPIQNLEPPKQNKTITNLTFIRDKAPLDIQKVYNSPAPPIATFEEFQKYLEDDIKDEGVSIAIPSIQSVDTSLNSSIEEYDKEEDLNTTTAAVASVDTTNFEKLYSLDELTVNQFWSLILQTYIPEGCYYPLPKDITERLREPFPLAKSFIESLVDPEKDTGFRSGTSIAFRSYHQTVFTQLQIPWCLNKTHQSASALYQKAVDRRVDFYCPWEGCKVTKRWYLVEPSLLKHILKNKRVSGETGIVKHHILEQFVDQKKHNSIPADCYLVVELFGNTLSHKHIKGSKGGTRVYIEESLKDIAEIKEHLKQQAKSLNGNLIKLLAKSITPVLSMAQSLLNQPAEAFIGGFTDVTPHTLACYQKDNQKMRKKLLDEYGLKDDQLGTLSSSLKKMLDTFWNTDLENRKKFADRIPFNAKNCVVGYIQQLFFNKEHWACICFRESQLLSFICDLKVVPALFWDGTEPNSKKQHNAMMFPLLTRPSYGKYSEVTDSTTTAPCRMVARLFTSMRTADIQIQFFQLLIDKSAHYLSTRLSLKDVVLVTDMDVIVDEIVSHFGMKNYWDHRHVNQAVKKHFKGKKCLSLVFYYLEQIRACDIRSNTEKLITELENILTKKVISQKQTKVEVVNSFYCEEGWNYLKRYIFKDLNKICYWTIKHLPDSWRWSQAVESCHNKDLNIWNQGTINMSMEETILRFSEIDNAEMRANYLHFVSAEYTELKAAVLAKRKNVQHKFKLSLVRDYANIIQKAKKEDLSESEDEEDDNDEGDLFGFTEKPLTIITKTLQLKQFLESQSAISIEQNNKIPKTKFSKPSKQRKQTNPKTLSHQEEILAHIFQDGELSEKVPLVTNKGKTSVASYYLWDIHFLKSLSRDKIQKLARKHLSIATSNFTKIQLIEKLLEKKSLLLKNNNTPQDLEIKFDKNKPHTWTQEQLNSFKIGELKQMCKEFDLHCPKSRVEILKVLLAYSTISNTSKKRQSEPEPEFEQVSKKLKLSSSKNSKGKKSKSMSLNETKRSKSKSLPLEEIDELESKSLSLDKTKKLEFKSLPSNEADELESKSLFLSETNRLESKSLPLSETNSLESKSLLLSEPKKLESKSLSPLNETKRPSSIENNSMLKLSKEQFHCCNGVVIDSLLSDLEKMEKDKYFYITDNLMNSMFWILQLSFPNIQFWSSYALTSSKRIVEVTEQLKTDLFVPFHTGSHWTLVHYSNQKWTLYDANYSLGRSSFENLKQRFKSVFPTLQMEGLIYDHQDDNHSCGIYVILYVYLIIQQQLQLSTSWVLSVVLPKLRIAIIEDIRNFLNNKPFFTFQSALTQFVASPVLLKKDFIIKTVCFNQDIQKNQKKTTLTQKTAPIDKKISQKKQKVSNNEQSKEQSEVRKSTRQKNVIKYLSYERKQ